MIKLIATAIVAILLTACQSTGPSGGVNTGAAGTPSVGQLGSVADISTNIALACNSAQAILQLPGTQQGLDAGLGKVVVPAQKLAGKVQAYCGLGQLGGGLLASVLAQVNTPAAQLLGAGVAK